MSLCITLSKSQAVYLNLGMKLTAVHRGITFCQSTWMEPYIKRNTELRKSATNSFETDF